MCWDLLLRESVPWSFCSSQRCCLTSLQRINTWYLFQSCPQSSGPVPVFPLFLSPSCVLTKKILKSIYTHILAFVVVFQCHGYQGSENPRHTECSHQAQHKTGSCNRNRLHSFRKLQSESQDHSASCNKQLSGHLCSNHHPTQRYVQGWPLLKQRFITVYILIFLDPILRTSLLLTYYSIFFLWLSFDYCLNSLLPCWRSSICDTKISVMKLFE